MSHAIEMIADGMLFLCGWKLMDHVFALTGDLAVDLYDFIQQRRFK